MVQEEDLNRKGALSLLWTTILTVFPMKIQNAKRCVVMVEVDVVDVVGGARGKARGKARARARVDEEARAAEAEVASRFTHHYHLCLNGSSMYIAPSDQ